MKSNSEIQIEHYVNKANKLQLSEPIPSTQIDYFVKKSNELLEGSLSVPETTTDKKTKLNYTHPSQIVANNQIIQKALQSYYNIK
ncbi:hypothetical protein [Priestia megaterium]|uniref:Uncharacterized protein n=1 Tax=Priestia megaterium TaxID=1404 RepID=A0A6M6E630_PRIMG|nr:hypothetical protein [Priestia megaterium]QJX79967.1 hypothetical protein FDZ14_28095 [Priestia megaterium]